MTELVLGTQRTSRQEKERSDKPGFDKSAFSGMELSEHSLWDVHLEGTAARWNSVPRGALVPAAPKSIVTLATVDRNFMQLFCKKIKPTKTLRPPAHWIHQDSVRALWVKYCSLHATGFLTFFHTCTKSLMFYCCIPVSAATPCSSGR